MSSRSIVLAVVFFLTLFLPGCARSLSTSTAGRPHVGPTRGRHVVARAQTRWGEVAVVEHADGSRALETEHGSWPRADAEDPLVVLLRRFHPAPRRVLVVGVGTGRVATQLDALGVEVDVIERDAALADLVRTHLGVRGHLVVDERAWELVAGQARSPELPRLGSAEPDDAYDALLVDEDIDPMKRWRIFVADRAGVQLTPRAFVAGRLRSSRVFFADGELEGPVVYAGERSDGGYDVVHVLSRADVPLDGDGLSLWPTAINIVPSNGQTGATKEVLAFGYVSRLPGGELVLEVPHDGPGAITMTLTGNVARARLGSRPDVGAPVVLSTLHASEQEYGTTLASLLGGGRQGEPVRRMLASPVVAAVRGRARLVRQGDLPGPSRSGVLYELEVTQIESLLDRASWAPVERRHVSRLEAAAKAIERGDLHAAAAAVEATRADLEDFLGKEAWRYGAFSLASYLAEDLERLSEKSSIERCEQLAVIGRPQLVGQLWPHPAERALVGSIKRTTERDMLRIARTGKRKDGERAARCWWSSTRNDPSFPTPVHFEIDRRFGIAY